jgi:hypothetical protein
MADEWKHKRSVASAQRQKDIAEVAELHRQGLTFREIAARRGRAVQWAWRRYHEALAQWREDSTQAVADLTAEINSQLKLVQREAYAAWERSKVDQERRRAKKRAGPPTIGEDGNPIKGKLIDTVEETEVRKRDGDPRHLDVALRAVEKRMRLFGLDKQTHEVGGKDGQPINLFQLLLQAPSEPATVVGEDGEEHVIEVKSLPAPGGNGDGFEDL